MVFLKFGSSRSQLELGFNVIKGVEKAILTSVNYYYYSVKIQQYVYKWRTNTTLNHGVELLLRTSRHVLLL
jgi:hypothetical protein